MEMDVDHWLPPWSSSSLFLMMSFSSFPSFSKLRMPWESKSVAILLLFISYLNSSSVALISGMSSSSALLASNLRGTSLWEFLSSSSRAGEMVRRSHPQSSLTSPVLLKEAPITMVLMPKRLQQLQISVTDCTPGSSAWFSQVLPVSFLNQSRMRPTKGEMRKRRLSAQAMAWTLWKTRVMLHLILFLRRASPALMPSQVEAILMRIRSLLTPACSQRAMILLARLMVSFLSKDRRASTSVETKPLIFSSSFWPKETHRWSQIRSIRSNLSFSFSFPHETGGASTFFFARVRAPQYCTKFLSPNSMEFTRISPKSGFLATCKMRVGLVVESSGWYFSIRLKSPVSATTKLCLLSWSSSDSSNLTLFLGSSPSTGSSLASMSYFRNNIVICQFEDHKYQRLWPSASYLSSPSSNGPGLLLTFGTDRQDWCGLG